MEENVVLKKEYRPYMWRKEFRPASVGMCLTHHGGSILLPQYWNGKRFGPSNHTFSNAYFMGNASGGVQNRSWCYATVEDMLKFGIPEENALKMATAGEADRFVKNKVKNLCDNENWILNTGHEEPFPNSKAEDFRAVRLLSGVVNMIGPAHRYSHLWNWKNISAFLLTEVGYAKYKAYCLTNSSKAEEQLQALARQPAVQPVGYPHVTPADKAMIEADKFDPPLDLTFFNPPAIQPPAKPRYVAPAGLMTEQPLWKPR